jgi:hypothetical protein
MSVQLTRDLANEYSTRYEDEFQKLLTIVPDFDTIPTNVEFITGTEEDWRVAQSAELALARVSLKSLL